MLIGNSPANEYSIDLYLENKSIQRKILHQHIQEIDAEILGALLLRNLGSNEQIRHYPPQKARTVPGGDAMDRDERAGLEDFK
jgi:hypothetical protein